MAQTRELTNVGIIVLCTPYSGSYWSMALRLLLIFPCQQVGLDNSHSIIRSSLLLWFLLHPLVADCLSFPHTVNPDITFSVV